MPTPAGPTGTTPSSLTITTTSLPAAAKNDGYLAPFAATGGNGTYAWTIATGALPLGLSLSSGGAISGVPLVMGSFPFTVAVQDTSAPPNSAFASYTLTVNPPQPLTITTASIPDTAIDSSVNIQLTATGSTAGYFWAISSGSLPPSLSLDSLGDLTGTATVAGTYTFTVQVQNAAFNSGVIATQTAEKTFTLNVTTPVAPDNSTLNGHYAFYMSGSTVSSAPGCTPAYGEPDDRRQLRCRRRWQRHAGRV